jgi:hypothetical protein
MTTSKLAALLKMMDRNDPQERGYMADACWLTERGVIVLDDDEGKWFEQFRVRYNGVMRRLHDDPIEPSEDMCIPLSQGKYAIIDASDYELVAGYAWHLNMARPDDPLCPRYAATTITLESGKRQCVKMHRLIMGAQPRQQVDHRNGNGLDNRRANLRFSDASKNMHNRWVRDTTSQYKGVNWDAETGKWQARLRVGPDAGAGSLGYFHNEVDAAIAYDLAAIDQLGDDAAPNFPPRILELVRAQFGTPKE